MSAQGGTLARRGTAHLPIWPVAALAAAAVAVAIGLAVLGGTEGRVVTQVTDQERFANSFAGIREQGAVLPSVRSLDMTALENASFWSIGQAEAYVAGQVTYPHGLENPGTYPADDTFTPKVGGHRPTTVNGQVCGQCR